MNDSAPLAGNQQDAHVAREQSRILSGESSSLKSDEIFTF